MMAPALCAEHAGPTMAMLSFAEHSQHSLFCAPAARAGSTARSACLLRGMRRLFSPQGWPACAEGPWEEAPPKRVPIVQPLHLQGQLPSTGHSLRSIASVAANKADREVSRV